MVKLSNCLVPDFLAQQGGEVVQPHGPQVLAGAVARGDGAVFHIPVAHHQHVGDLLQGGLPDLLADLLVPGVHLAAEAQPVQLGGHLGGVPLRPVGDGKHLHLHRGQPGRERPGEVLGDAADEPLDGAQHHPVDHHGAVLLAVLAGVLQLEPLGELGIQLDGAALPGVPQGVGQMEVQLGAVERAVPLVDNELLAHAGNGVLQDVLVALPLVHGADVVLRHGGQLNGVGQAEGGVHLVEQPHRLLDHVLHLVPGHEHVGVVLGEAAHPEQAVEGPGQLVAVDQTQLSHPQGQLLVGVGLAGVHQHAAGAVHGLDGEVHVVDDGGVHIVLVVVPVTGALPELAVEHDGRGDFHVAVFLMHLPPIVDEGVFQHHPLGQEEGEAGALVPEHEQAQLLAQPAVVPLLGLLDLGQVLVQLVLLGEGHAVDALEGLPAGIPPPVGGVAGGELDGVALDAPGGVQVGAGAQVGELALPVEGDHRVLGQVVDELHLEGLALLLHEFDRFLTGQLEPLQLQLFLADLAHLGLKLGKLPLGEGLGGVEVVVEAVVDGRADGQLHLRVEALHGLGKHMGAGVPVSLAVLLVFKSVRIIFLGHKYPSSVNFSGDSLSPGGGIVKRGEQRRQGLAVGRAADPLFRDDAGDEGVVGHVEGGVVALHPRGGHGPDVEFGADLLRVPEFDLDIIPGGAVQVDGGGGAQDVEGDAVVLGQDGHAAGADFVGGVPVGGHPVAAHEAGVYPAVFHHDRGHVVADEGYVHPGLVKLVGGEAGPLEQGAGLVGKHPEAHPPLRPQQEGAQGGAVLGGGQRPGVAVGEHPVPVPEEGEAVLRDGPAHGDVLLMDGNGLLPQGGGDGGGGGVPHGVGPPSQAAQRPAQVDRRGPGGVEAGGQPVELGAKPVRRQAFPLLGQRGQAVPGADADGRGPPHPQGLDGLDHLLRGAQGEVFDLVGQEGLVQDDHAGQIVPQADVTAEIL